MALAGIPVTGGSGYVVSFDSFGNASPPASGERQQWIGLCAGAVGALAPMSATNPLNVDGIGGRVTGTVATGAANTVIKASAGRLCRVLVTTAGTGSGNVLIFDNATTNSGTVIGMVPATIAIGTFYVFDMPAGAGIVVQNVASGPVLTVSYI